MPLSLRRRRGAPAENEPDGAAPEAPPETPEARPTDTAGDTVTDTITDTVTDTAAETPLPGARPGGSRVGERRRTLGHSTVVLLLRAAHPRQALLIAGGLAIAAAMSGRPGREVGLVFATALVGHAVLGWHNDLVDRRRDARRLPSGKPMADGYLDAGTTWFALLCALLLLVPLAISNGVTAGCFFLVSVVIGMLGNLALRKTWLSWLTWAVSFGLYPAFLSYGGWGGAAEGDPPEPAMVALAVALGLGVHVLCALPGLVADHEDGYRSLPLRIALKLGAARLLVVALAWTALVLVGFLVVGDAVGLSR